MVSSSVKKKSWWRENLSLKLISLILAVLLELYFYSPDNSLTLSLPVTIDVQNIPANLMYINPRNGERGLTARLEIRGPRPLIEQVRNSPHHYPLEYPENHPLTFSVPVDPSKFGLPAGVEVLSIEPQVVTVELEASVEKEFPVDLVQEGNIAPGYLLEKVALSVSKVKVFGPASEVAEIKSVKTTTLTLEGLAENRRFELPLQNPGLYTRMDVQTVIADVDVIVIPSEKGFEKVNVRIISPHGYAGTVEPSRVKAVLVGPKEALEKIPAQGLELLADCQQLAEGKHQVDLSATLPDGVKLGSTEPKKVTVNLVRQ